MHLYEVLRRPLITEKNTALQAQSKYAFEVADEANKQQVKAGRGEGFQGHGDRGQCDDRAGQDAPDGPAADA